MHSVLELLMQGACRLGDGTWRLSQIIGGSDEASGGYRDHPRTVAS